MKQLIIFFVGVLCFSESFSQNYWISQSSPTDKKLHECYFTDSLYGWAVGDSGAIVHTANSGASWSLQHSGTLISSLLDVFFLNRNEGWIVYVDSTYKTAVLKTVNGGAVWTKTFFPDTTMLFSTIAFTSSLTGYISGYSGRIFKTTNGGSAWFDCGYDTTSCLYLFPKNDIYFVNSNTGYSCGGVIDLQGIALVTTNAGLTWRSQCVSAEPMNEIKPYGGNIYISGGDFDLGSMFIRSTNSGVNWVYDTTGCFGNAQGFSFRTAAEVWAALSFSAKFAVNLDSMRPGSSWQCISTPDNLEITDVEFQSPTKGWAFGSGGRIYAYNPAVIGITGNGTVPLYAELHQNYPNPFNPSTVIKYSLPRARVVVITIYDISGREVVTYAEGYKEPGHHSIEVNSSELASGVYFYRLTAGEFSLSKKMMVIK